MSEVDGPPRPKPPWRTAAALAGLFVVDLVGTGAGFFAMFTAFIGGSVLAFGTLWALIRNHGGTARTRALKFAMYMLLGGATIATLRFHTSTAETAADRVIEGCRSYEADRGELPGQLSDLVPGYLDAIPVAKLTLMYGNFTYWSEPSDTHTLEYVVVPPFGRRLYNFENDAWSTLD